MLQGVFGMAPMQMPNSLLSRSLIELHRKWFVDKSILIVGTGQKLSPNSARYYLIIGLDWKKQEKLINSPLSGKKQKSVRTVSRTTWMDWTRSRSWRWKAAFEELLVTLRDAPNVTSHTKREPAWKVYISKQNVKLLEKKIVVYFWPLNKVNSWTKSINHKSKYWQMWPT